MKRFIDKLSNKLFPWGAVVSGATSLYNILSNDSQRGKNVETSKELMDYQTKKSQEQQAWLFQNQYPMQVQAMKAAGLNPALSSSQLGAVSANQPSATLNQQAPQLNPLDVARSISELRLLSANEKNINADTENKTADAENKRASTDLMSAELVGYFPKLSAELNKAMSESNRNEAETQVASKRLEMMDAEIDQIKAAQADLIASAVNKFANARLTNKQADSWDAKVKAEIAQAFANAGYMNAQAKETMSLLMFKQFNYAAMTRLSDSQADLFDTNNAMQDFLLKQEYKYNDAKQLVGIWKDATQGIVNVTEGAKNISDALNPLW